jgi:acetyltransferase-like isoleucine patch superfamily enzyme
MRDISGLIFNKFSYIIQLKILNIFSSIICNVIIRIKGIHLGKNCSFFGLPKFYRTENSKIKISDRCSFRSRKTSNLIGIDRPCILSTLVPGAELIIGENCGFSGTVIGAFKSVRLGNNVRCGANTLITDSNWHLDDPRSGYPKEIVINDNVWLGAGSTVLKGVEIGENSVIGAGSVVTKNIPANVIAAGNPCRVIRAIN